MKHERASFHCFLIENLIEITDISEIHVFCVKLIDNYIHTECTLDVGTKINCSNDNGETFWKYSLVQIEQFDCPLKAKRPFPVSSSELEFSLVCTTRKTTTFEVNFPIFVYLLTKAIIAKKHLISSFLLVILPFMSTI